MVMALAAQLVGFAHPSVLEIGEGQFSPFAPDTSRAMAVDIVGRLHWSVTHASWWVVQVIFAITLLRLFWIDTRACACLGRRMRQFYFVGLTIVVTLMVGAGLAGVQFAGPFAAALQALPVGPTGRVLAAGVVAVNTGSAMLSFMLALGFCANILRARCARSESGSRGARRFEQLLWIGAAYLALTALEVTLGLRWASTLVEPSAGELAAAVACAQARVVGAVSSLTLGTMALAAWAGLGHEVRAPVTRCAAWVLAVLLPLSVALVGGRCPTA